MLLSEMDIFFSEKDEFYRSVHSVASLKILKGRTNFFFEGGYNGTHDQAPHH